VQSFGKFQARRGGRGWRRQIANLNQVSAREKDSEREAETDTEKESEGERVRERERERARERERERERTMSSSERRERAATSEEGTLPNVSKILTRKPGPDAGRVSRICAKFARPRAV